MPSEAPVVRIERLAKDYVIDWRGRTVRALDEVSLAVARGTICALVGANGSGKTTMLKLCAGLVRPTHGRCEIAGLAPADAVRAGRVAYLPEETMLPDFATAEEFLRRLAAIAGLDAARAASAAADALAQTSLGELATRPIATFSKGQRQRLGLAQALLRAPEVLLLDEPASGLDPRGQAAMRELLAEQRRAGRTVVLSSHFWPHLEELCDQFVVLEGGRVVFDGSAAEVAARGGLEKIQLEAAPV